MGSAGFCPRWPVFVATQEFLKKGKRLTLPPPAPPRWIHQSTARGAPGLAPVSSGVEKTIQESRIFVEWKKKFW